MRRWAPSWTEALKARAARYALERSLGPFLEERLRLEQLSLDLRGGTGTLRNLRLSAAAVDEVLAEAGAPLELREGCVGSVTVTVPWAALGTEPCGLRLTRLRLALGPRPRGGLGPCPPHQGKPSRAPHPEPPLEGLEALALTIDTVLRRLRVELEDTELRLELPLGGALELQLPWVRYQDEGGGSFGGPPPAVLLKSLSLRQPQLLLCPPPMVGSPPPLLVGLSPGPSQFSLRLKQNQALPGPLVELEGQVGALHLLLPPPMLGALRELLGAWDPPDPEPPPPGRSRPPAPQDLAWIERELSRCLQAGGAAEPPQEHDPEADLFYSMSGSLGGGEESLGGPPGDPSSRSPPQSPSLGPPPRQPSQDPPSLASSAWGGPWRRGGLRLRLTLGTATATLPYGGGGWPPPGSPLRLWEGGGSDLPFPHLRLSAGGAEAGLELGLGESPLGQLSLARLQIVERLRGDPERLQVLCFPGAEPGPPQPVLRLRYGPAPAGPRPSEPPPPELSLSLGALSSDLDLGLLDRLGPALSAIGCGQPQGGQREPSDGEPAWAWPRLRWAAPGAELRLWLPRADLRPPSARGPSPRLRPEAFRMVLGGPRGWAGPGGTAGVRCDHLMVFYDSPDLGSVPWLRAEPGPPPGGGSSILPMLEVTLQDPLPKPKAPPGPPPTPFTARRSLYESHELVQPGTPEELEGFVGGALGGARCSLRLSLPRAHLRLSPPQLGQRLYNRINNDLLLWEPGSADPAGSAAPPAGEGQSAPGVAGSHALSGDRGQSGSASLSGDSFKPCGAALGSDSDSEEEAEVPSVPAGGPGPGPAGGPGATLSSVALLVTVTRGQVTADCQLPEAPGGSRLVLEVEEGRSCLLAGGGQSRAMAELRWLRLHHGPMPEEEGEALEVPGEGEDLGGSSQFGGSQFKGAPPDLLHPILVPWEEPEPPPGTPKVSRMLSLALRSQLNPPGDVKELAVAVALEGVALRHRPEPPGLDWFSQLVALLAVEEEPVPGYQVPTPLTQLHLSLCRCCALYRPPPLPLRVLLTAETLGVTCSLRGDSFQLRLLVDDGAVALSQRQGERLRLHTDFVCVLDVDFLELALSSWKGTGGDPPCPTDELRVGPARLRARTCPDSTAALARLLRLLGTPSPAPPPAAPPGPTPGPTACPTPAPSPGPTAGPATGPTAASRDSQINQQDLTDALRDTPSVPPGAAPPPPPPPPVSFYWFPGEGGGGGASRTTPAPPPPQPPRDLPLQSEPPGAPPTDQDGFCILEAPPSPGSLPSPRIRWLQPPPLRLLEGHFGPPLGGGRDLLKPPPGLPPPCHRLLLSDLTFDWLLHGGRDFGPGPAHRTRPRGRGRAHTGPAPWRSQGGPGRSQELVMELHLGKVSLQHESYAPPPPPPPPPPASPPPPSQLPLGGVTGELPTSRLVLLVQDLELRDRLGGGSSHAPPFLCRHPRGGGPPPQPPTLCLKALRVLPQPPPPGGVPECCLRVTLSPLRLHIDQDALLFLRDFVSSFIQHMGNPPRDFPVPGDPPGLEPLVGEEPDSDPPVYFRQVRFTAEVPLWLDYRGTRVTMEQGALAGILIGLGRLNCCQLRLRRLSHRQGLLGLGKVLSWAVAEWLRDIRCHQLPALLGGVAPVQAVLSLWRALRDLLALPLLPLLPAGGGAGGVTRGVARGVAALGLASASAALGLGSRLRRALQALAEALYELVAPTGPPRPLEAPPDPHQSPPGGCSPSGARRQPQ